MRPLNVFFKDMKIVFTKPMLLVSFIAVAFIPVLYSGFLIESSWDPYGHLEKLPVAVVNLDKGAQYEGKALDVGNDFVTELKKNGDFKWNFVSAEAAQDGMENNKFYMTVTIPEDFSTKATTLMNKDPQQAEIIFEPNGEYNFIGGQIGNSAVKDLKAELSEQITAAYTRSMFDQIDDLAGGLKTASSGAGELSDGASKLEQGTAALKANLAKLADGTLQLKSGLASASGGAVTLHQGSASLVAGASGLSDGLQQLTAAERQLQSGAYSAAQAAAQLQAGLQSAADSGAKLSAGLQAAADGGAKLGDGLASSAAAGSQVADGAQSVAASLQQLVAAHPELAGDEQVKQLLAASRSVADSSAKLSAGQRQLLESGKSLQAGQQQLLQGGEALQAGHERLLQGAAKLSAGQRQLEGGLQQFGGKLSEAAAGGAKVAAGASRLSSGAEKLQSGLGALADGVSSVASGAGRLNSGAGELQSGAIKLVSGSGELAAKLGDAAEQTASVNTADNTVDMFAGPVKVTENDDRKVEQYGTGIAPYFISMALFVGALIFTTVVSARESYTPGASGMGRFASRTLTFVAMSAAQSVAADLILLYGLKLDVANVPMFILFTLAASLTFTLIVQAIVTWLDQPGRFLVVMLMILQLTSSGGTFPVELLPEWMQKLNPWLPMTHTIIGFKGAIASGDTNAAWGQIGTLAIYMAIFLALTFAYFISRGRGVRSEPELPIPA
ncbi:YhgE/Pip family protein [Paenibacillus beijingensis]|uniref:Membrane protein n=1 Tax=Paenibacillus beijingensis TaxID=1126833 RepID=A0A0D5NFM2_9BACL|nr:YhgE/Pip domain-containing protein [Paenibacillus beijingensis]AJY74066.1 membrane protein [Paenibacillus beijingensis]